MNDIERVLIVDDDPAQAEMVSEFLRISGFAIVDWANNIGQLWVYLKTHEYDIVLLDYKLPDGTGLDVLAQMSKSGYQVPVIMITGQGNERIAVQAIKHGAADYLMKGSDYLVTLPSLMYKAVKARRMQESIQRSLEQIRYQATLLNNVRDAIVVWDMHGHITYWNPAATTLFGWQADERIGKPVHDVYLNAFSPPIQPTGDGNTAGQQVVRYYTQPDGKRIWVSSRVTPLQDSGDSNRAIGYMDVSNDITRRIEAEQALRESEARYRAIVEDYQTELICRFKPDGTLTFVNEVFCRYFKKPRSELVGANFFAFLPPEERQKTLNCLTSFNPEQPVKLVEHQVILPNQERRWLQRTDRAIFDDQEQIFEFQAVSRDITENKKMAAQIQAAQAHLVQAARLATIGEMASGVAHQIYNPLTTIIADAQLLLRKMPLEQSERESAEAIIEAGWRLQQVVQHLMEFSRPENDSLDSLLINETLKRALSLVGAQIEAIGCQVQTDLDEDIPTVHGNSRQLEDLWVNLLLLARDASINGNGHNIHVTSKADTRDQIIVEIRDNGTPIPTDQLDTIFEPNFVGPTIGRGTGMELSICREIVRQHGGEIAVESVPGHDTIFRVLLPTQVERNK